MCTFYLVYLLTDRVSNKAFHIGRDSDQLSLPFRVALFVALFYKEEEEEASTLF